MARGDCPASSGPSERLASAARRGIEAKQVAPGRQVKRGRWVTLEDLGRRAHLDCKAPKGLPVQRGPSASEDPKAGGARGVLTATGGRKGPLDCRARMVRQENWASTGTRGGSASRVTPGRRGFRAFKDPLDLRGPKELQESLDQRGHRGRWGHWGRWALGGRWGGPEREDCLVNWERRGTSVYPATTGSRV